MFYLSTLNPCWVDARTIAWISAHPIRKETCKRPSNRVWFKTVETGSKNNCWKIERYDHMNINNILSNKTSSHRLHSTSNYSNVWITVVNMGLTENKVLRIWCFTIFEDKSTYRWIYQFPFRWYLSYISHFLLVKSTQCHTWLVVSCRVSLWYPCISLQHHHFIYRLYPNHLN